MGKFVIRETKTGIKFDLKATNGEVIATSEVYSSAASCNKGIASVQRNAPIARWRIRQWRAMLLTSTPSLRSIWTRPASSASV